MLRAAVLFGAAALASCAPAADQEALIGQPFSAGPYGPGGPPQIGSIDALIGDEPVSRRVYDYSVGAVDPGALTVPAPGGVRLFLIGATPPDPFRHAGELRLEAVLPDLAPGEGPLTMRLLVDGEDDGPRLEGEGRLALLQVAPPPEDTSISLYGRITGRFEASLCPAGGHPPGPCLPASGSFDTAVYENR
ncbi:hypothetical protein EAT49_19375 [Histidinibacterium lentulum]|uniref:Lipoprotein n=2 Tax=Histidinibacterium lentulum TaxID=2480588 RepID=A0A3N2QKW6_9RHOB|nr:hypothetical protein EAT49_19375 [Histidinibacterium lentulum]